MDIPTQTIIVTDWSWTPVGDYEMAESGAKWSKRGQPVNKNAAILMDFCALYARDDD